MLAETLVVGVEQPDEGYWLGLFVDDPEAVRAIRAKRRPAPTIPSG